MYEFIWRSLPGNWFVKLVISLILIALVVFVLMQYVFPVIAPYMPFNDATVDEGALSGPGVAGLTVFGLGGSS